MTERIAVPGPSYIKEEPVSLRGPAGEGEAGRRLSAGMSEPSIMDDGWWLTHLWVADEIWCRGGDRRCGARRRSASGNSVGRDRTSSGRVTLGVDRRRGWAPADSAAHAPRAGRVPAVGAAASVHARDPLGPCPGLGDAAQRAREGAAPRLRGGGRSGRSTGLARGRFLPPMRRRGSKGISGSFPPLLGAYLAVQGR